MARLFIDGFEGGDTTLWNGAWGAYAKASASSSPPAAFSGSYYVNMGGYSLYKILSASESAIYLAFKIIIQSRSSTTRDVCGFADSAGTLAAVVRLTGNPGYFCLRIGSSTVETGSTNLSVDIAYLLEIKYIPLNSGGTFELKINGNVEFTYSGDTTNGLENVQGIIVGRCGGDAPEFYCDDVVVDDADYPGNTRIQAIVPTGAGTTTQWDPSTGNNYACVDERPASDTDYVSTNTTDEIDTYAMGDLSGAVSVVKCLQIQARIAYEGSPTPTHIQLGCRSNGADYFDGDISPTSGFATVAKILETDPDTETAWLAEAVDSSEFGVKATA